jgi:hypothetical protein
MLYLDRWTVQGSSFYIYVAVIAAFRKFLFAPDPTRAPWSCESALNMFRIGDTCRLLSYVHLPALVASASLSCMALLRADWLSDAMMAFGFLLYARPGTPLAFCSDNFVFFLDSVFIMTSAFEMGEVWLRCNALFQCPARHEGADSNPPLVSCGLLS